jgi:hypothetical protein
MSRLRTFLYQFEEWDESRPWSKLLIRLFTKPKATTLLDVMANLDRYHGGEVIYAKTPWRRNSVAMVSFEPQVPNKPPINMPDEAKRLGLEYFHNVVLVRERFSKDGSLTSDVWPPRRRNAIV